MSLKIQINTEVIKKLNPCEDRFNNWLMHYSNFNGDILEFLDLDKITAQDKIWLSVRLLPREQLEYFAIDSVFAATEYAADADAAAYAAASAAAYATYATYSTSAVSAAAAVAAYAAYAAAYAATDAAAERDRQVDCLAYLIETADT